MNKLIISTLLGLAFSANNAHAGSLTAVEPDSFVDGMDISNATLGVLLVTNYGTSEFKFPVLSYDTENADYASTGTKVFGHYCFAPDCYYTSPPANNASAEINVFGYNPVLVDPNWDNQNIFRAFFPSSAKYVAIDVINNNGTSQGTDIASMQVFGTSGLLTTIAATSIGFPGHQTLSYQSGSSNIQYIQLSSSDGSRFGLDHLQFQVPEPSTLVLISIGLLGYFLRRERLDRAEMGWRA